MRLAILVVVLLALCSSQTLAQEQDAKHNVLGLSVGMEFLGSHDEIGSPLTYSGYAFPLQVVYGCRDSTVSHRVSWDISSSFLNAPPLQNSYSTDYWVHKAYYAVSALTYEFRREWGPILGGSVSLSYGGQLDARVFARGYKYYGGDVYSMEGSASGEASVALGPVLTAEHSFDASTIANLTVAIPMVAYVIRPPWGLISKDESESPTAWILSQGRLRVIGQFVGCNARLECVRTLSTCFSVRMTLGSSFYLFPGEWSSASVQSTAALGLDWRFRW